MIDGVGLGSPSRAKTAPLVVHYPEWVSNGKEPLLSGAGLVALRWCLNQQTNTSVRLYVCVCVCAMRLLKRCHI